MSDAPAFRLDPAATCDACGCHGAFHFDGETLCADCYADRGSCCSAEFSGRPYEEEPHPAPAPPDTEEN